MTRTTTAETVTNPAAASFPRDQVLDLADHGVAVLDRSGVVVSWNAWLVEYFRVPASAALGRTLNELFDTTLSLRLVTAIADCIEHSRSHILSSSLNRQLFPLTFDQDGTGAGCDIAQTVTIKPIRLDEHTRFCLLQITDVSLSVRRERFLRRQAAELSRLVEELKSAKDEATRANLAKSEFLTDMSHELRSPLNAIIGFSQMMERRQAGELTEEQIEFTCYIRRAGEHLLRLISDILDLSRIEAKNVALVFDDLSADELVEEAVRSMRSLAQSRGITVSHVRTTDGPLTLRADRTRMAQILLNLLSNAIKYNRDGGQVTVSSEQLAPGFVRITVADTGPGIPPERQHELFQNFSRLGAEFTEVEGAGVGLALSRKLAELMEGVMGFESHLGAGSNFWVEMPSSKPLGVAEFITPDSEMDPVAQPKLPAMTVLHIEDNPVDLRLVNAQFQSQPKVQLIPARTGEAGLQLARQAPPDVILLDLHLPGLNGFEVLRALSQDERTCAIPVIAVTASALPDDRVRGLAAGFMAWLTKPLDSARLLTIMAGLAARTARSQEPPVR